MDNQRRVDQVAMAIKRLLEGGLALDASTLAAAASAHGDASPQSLAAVLADRESSEAASLVQLLLYPDAAAMLALEPVLAAVRLTPEQACEAATAVSERVDAVELFWPGGESLRLAFEPGDARAFVFRFKPDVNPPQEAAALLGERLSGEAALSALVRLRQTNLGWSPARLAFLLDLLRGLTSPNRRFALEAMQWPGSLGENHQVLLEVLAWALRFMDAEPEDFEPVAALVRRHRDVTGHLKNAERLEEMRALSSQEALAAQGVRPPHLHAPDLERELALIETAAGAIGAGYALVTLGVIDRDLGDPESVEDVFARLGGVNPP